MVKVAFYKGRASLLDRVIQWWTRGVYSHVEIVVGDLWYASSPHDGGVRVMTHTPNKDHWDFVELPWVTPGEVTEYFKPRLGVKYDLFGALGFAFRSATQDPKRQFCSEIVAEFLGINEGWRYSPNSLHPVIVSMVSNYEKIVIGQ